MKNNLPYLNQERLQIIFSLLRDTRSADEKLNHLISTLHSMQGFNLEHRPDDTCHLYGLLDPIFNFPSNSEGGMIWVSLALAVQDLYGFSDKKLIIVLKQLLYGDKKQH